MAIVPVVPPLRALLGRLRLRQVLLVVAISDLTSLRKAADQVGISQPAATKMLVELEAALGVPLFERGRRGMAPTVYGSAVIRHAYLVISDVGAMRDELSGLALGTAGRLAIGIECSNFFPYCVSKDDVREKSLNKDYLCRAGTHRGSRRNSNQLQSFGD